MRNLAELVFVTELKEGNIINSLYNIFRVRKVIEVQE